MFFPIIILDIHDQGLKFIDAESSKVEIFHEMKYFRTGWIETKSPILVLLPEGQNCPLKIEETFFSVNEEKPSNAYALTIFDTNKDKIIDINDEFYKHLHLWLNPNKDGVCKPEDVKSLYQLGISINLDFQPVHEWTQQGHLINYSFTFNVRYTQENGKRIYIDGLKGYDVALNSIPLSE